ncbi:MAG: hypothetical protein MUE81_07455 [Thermoflexibacter sp.]|jgi:hypothetical protein|nr:hypothetical protein [Thermoflexibacter sp.]
MRKLYFFYFLFLSILFISACGENIEERDRKIKQSLMKITNGVPCISLTVTPDSADKEVLVAIGIMEDSARVEALIKKDEKTKDYIGRETFGSFLARDMSSNIGMRVTDLALKPTNTPNVFEGKALLKTGEKISFIAHPEKGWYPIDNIDVLTTIIKYQVMKSLEKGKVLDSISIAPEGVSRYRGKFILKSGEEQWIYVVHSGDGFSWNLSEAYTPSPK